MLQEWIASQQEAAMPCGRRFVIESTVEENVQRLSSQRAAAMDLSAATGTRGKQAGLQDPLTVRSACHLPAQVTPLLGPADSCWPLLTLVTIVRLG